MQVQKNCLPATVTMTGTAMRIGKPLCVRNKDRASFQMVWDGTPTGVFTFQVCNQRDILDGEGNVLASAKWTTLISPAAFAAQQPAGAYPTEPLGTATGGKGYFTFADLSTEWIRPVYVNASSSGNWTAADGSAGGVA